MKIWNKENHATWGDHIGLDFPERRINGHLTPLPKNGDEFRCMAKSGKIMRFEIKNIKYCSDPSDMFFADIKDIGYL